MGKVLTTLLAAVLGAGLGAVVWAVARIKQRAATDVDPDAGRHALAWWAGLAGLAVGVLLSNTRFLIGTRPEGGGGFLGFIWLPVVLAVVLAAFGAFVAGTTEGRRRPWMMVGGGAVVGAALGLMVRSEHDVGMEPLRMLAFTAGGAVIGLLVSLVLRRHRLVSAGVGAAVGYVAGAWEGAELPPNSVLGKTLSTLLTVIVAVGASGGIWLLANKTFDQARRRWRLFTAVCFGAIGLLVGILLAGNRLTVGSTTPEEGGFVRFIWLPVLAAIALAVVGLVVERITEPRLRLLVSTAAAGGLGVIAGLLIREEYRPALDGAAIAIWTAIGALLGAAVSRLRTRTRMPVGGALIGAGLGFLVGAWGGADLGAGSSVEAIIAAAVPAAALGAGYGITPNADAHRRARIDRNSRAYIFLVPALFFIAVALVIPAIRTLYLSFLDRGSEEVVGFDNYRETFTDRASWDASGWTDMFTSRLWFIGLALLAIALVVGLNVKRKTGRAVEIGNPTTAPLIGGALFIAFAVFSSVRGTISNNLWWVVFVVFAATSIGLAIAVLADRSRHEKLAKSLIFMPLAISLVGASVIWRFVYQPRDASIEQTGLFNALWVGLGRLSTGEGLPTLIIGVVCVVALTALLVVTARRLVARAWGKVALPGIGVLLLGWFTIRYVSGGLGWLGVGDGVGGFVENSQGVTVPKAIDFVGTSPFNNVWLMVILIWIQAGFAMVILSAAIKAVPDEIIEAARMDGASTSQIFWRVTLPQIATTIGVVVTTLIVTVMKVFDIVKVVTNGNFDTQVLANDMFQKAFAETNTGRGAALAMLIFVSVLPVMIFNIRRMQREA